MDALRWREVAQSAKNNEDFYCHKRERGIEREFSVKWACSAITPDARIAGKLFLESTHTRVRPPCPTGTQVGRQFYWLKRQWLRGSTGRPISAPLTSTALSAITADTDGHNSQLPAPVSHHISLSEQHTGGSHCLVIKTNINSQWNYQQLFSATTMVVGIHQSTARQNQSADTYIRKFYRAGHENFRNFCFYTETFSLKYPLLNNLNV